jgi:hypothetical protein
MGPDEYSIEKMSPTPKRSELKISGKEPPQKQSEKPDEEPPQKQSGKSGEEPPQKRGLGLPIKVAIVLIVIVIVAAGAFYAIDELELLRPSEVPEDVPADMQETPPSYVMTSPDIISFSISPQEITAVESATLQWEVTNAESVTIDHDIGEVDSTGSMSVSPETDTTYELIATNEVGSTSRTVSISVLENVNASELAITEKDVKPSGFIFVRHSEPSIDDTVSTYDITFERYGEVLNNTISIHTTIEAAEKRYNDIKYDNRREVTDVVTIGERGYVLTYVTEDTVKETYVINFQKYNVYVRIGGISDYDELISLAELVESRIK